MRHGKGHLNVSIFSNADIQMVGKLFSKISKRRMPSQNKHHIDWMASKQGLGPKLFASTDDGILMEWLQEESLNATTVHGSVEWIARVAPRLAAFHYMETPHPPNVLWESMNVMIRMMQDASLVERQVWRQRESIEPLDLPTVLGHGDLKPSNIIGDRLPRFIDLEISGMHYRGFDLAKLFRTDHPTYMTEGNLKRFLECYIRSSPIPVKGDRELDLLRLETKIMEPLTVRIVYHSNSLMVRLSHSYDAHGFLWHQWLEAAVFFACSASMDPENRDKWRSLARDRLESYETSVCSLEHCISEYQEKR